jgi:hypothetical protein
MRLLSVLATGIVITAAAGCGPRAGSLEGAAAALGAADIRSVEYSGTGRWFQFGQAPNPTLPWPPFDLSRFTAAVDYQQPSARVEMVRRQVVEPGRVRPAPVEQRPIQVVNGTFAWNLAAPAGGAAGARAATRSGRRTARRDLDDAARLPQSGGRQQGDRNGLRRRIGRDVHD